MGDRIEIHPETERGPWRVSVDDRHQFVIHRMPLYLDVKEVGKAGKKYRLVSEDEHFDQTRTETDATEYDDRWFVIYFEGLIPGKRYSLYEVLNHGAQEPLYREILYEGSFATTEPGTPDSNPEPESADDD